MAILERIFDRDSIITAYNNAIMQKKPYTNCYTIDIDLENLCSFYTYGQGFLMVSNKRGYYRLYYCTDDLNWLESLQGIKNFLDTLVIEVVSRDKIEPFYGLLHYQKRYSRYRRLGNSNVINSDPTCYCTIQDAKRVKRLMEENFSPIGNELLTLAEIETAISGENVVCIKNSEDICGYLIFEDKGKTSYLRNICVDKKYRSMGIGRRLLNMYHGIHRDYKSFTLWCDDENQAAIALYCSNQGGGGRYLL